MKKSWLAAALLTATLVALALVTSGPVTAGSASGTPRVSGPNVARAVASDVTPPLREMTPVAPSLLAPLQIGELGGGAPADTGHQPDGALQTETGTAAFGPTTAAGAKQPPPAAGIPAPRLTFEGPSNNDNAAIFPQFPFGVTPPDPVGDVGMHHYVAMVNLTFAIYNKQGTLLFGPADTGTLWQNFPVEDCTDPSGDPIVLYDEISNRWMLSQFTTRGLSDPTGQTPFYNCVAISTGQDPLGSYYRYAFSTGLNFPDYPKYGYMPNGLFITTREFAFDDTESIGIYAINRQQLNAGNPNPQIVSFQLTGPPNLVGDGLLPADFDGKRHPPPHSPEYIVGSQDDEAPDGATFDALNMFHLNVNWSNPAAATFQLVDQVPVAEFDSIFPCTPPESRECIPQPGTDQKLDILSYRQRPTWRLQYRNFKTHESLVTTQSVEALPGVAGMRWWELRSPLDPVLYQEGTWAPNDGIHRWMGSVAMDEQGNAALGYSVSNGTNVYPGIRYAGRLVNDPLGTLPQGEASLQEGSSAQIPGPPNTAVRRPRWGDYTSMNVDPKDDCSFWYINQYYAPPNASGRAWQTRIGVLKFPGCK